MLGSLQEPRLEIQTPGHTQTPLWLGLQTPGHTPRPVCGPGIASIEPRLIPEVAWREHCSVGLSSGCASESEEVHVKRQGVGNKRNPDHEPCFGQAGNEWLIVSVRWDLELGRLGHTFILFGSRDPSETLRSGHGLLMERFSGQTVYSGSDSVHF